MNINRFTIAAAASLIVFAFATEAMAAKVTWNASLWGKRRAFTENVEELARLVSEKTNGEFEIKLNYGQALSKAKENLDGISINAFEMAQICAGYHRDKNPTLTVLELPFLGVKDLQTEIKVSEAVYAYPAVQKDLARWNAKLLMASPMPQYNVVGVGDPPKTLDQFKGMRIRATGGIGNAFKTIGAVPTSVTASEAYNALESGVVNGVAFAPHAHIAFRTVDIAKWWTTNLNPGTVNCPVVVNIDAYNSLPDAYRKALDSSVKGAYTHYLASYEEVYKKWFPLLKKNGIEQITYSDAAIAGFKAKAAQPVWDKWLKEMDAQGLPGRELLDLVQKTINGS